MNYTAGFVPHGSKSNQLWSGVVVTYGAVQLVLMPSRKVSRRNSPQPKLAKELSVRLTYNQAYITEISNDAFVSLFN